MAVQTQSLPSNLLRNVLLADAAFEGVLGAILTVGSASLAVILGINALLLLITGFALIGVALFLYYFACIRTPTRSFTQIIMIANLVTAALLIGLLAGNVLPLTTAGQWSFLIVADILAVLAIGEYIALRRA